MEPIVGKPIFVLFKGNLAVYEVISKVDPETYRVEFIGQVKEHLRYEIVPEQILLLDPETREWQIKEFPFPHDVIILSPNILQEPIGKGRTACRRIYQQYKNRCPSDLYKFGIPYGQPPEYYQKLISELQACRDNRIIYGHQCDGADSGHLQAIIQSNLLLKTAIGASRARPTMTKDELNKEVWEFLQRWREDPERINRWLYGHSLEFYQKYLIDNAQSLIVPWSQYLGQFYGSFTEPSKEELLWFFSLAHDVYGDPLLGYL